LSSRELSLALLRDEVVQRKEEGCEVEEIAARLSKVGSDASEEDLEAIYRDLRSLSPRLDFPYVEPSGLEEIIEQRTSGPRRSQLDLTEDELYDRIYGAWLGRCVGCMLGKPVEGWTREKIQKYLELAGSHPLTNYIPEVTPHPKGYEFNEDYYKNAVRGEIACAARDDDLDYTILNLRVLEDHGFNFSSEDVGETWLILIPFMMTYTAERAAYANLVSGVKPPESATNRNPYREWIGAQIRADMWGYVVPGRPEAAAALAHRDASLSHVKNGIYGEMLVAAMISMAFTAQNPEEMVFAGLSEIPRKSRLAEAVMDVLEWKKEAQTWEEAWSKVMAKYGSYSGLHTINNAAIVLLALLYGEGDFEKAITISVMSGLDTDCNGATCGSIMGAALGSRKLPGKWVNPLNDSLESAVSGFSDCRISHLARRTFLLAKKFTHNERLT